MDKEVIKIFSKTSFLAVALQHFPGYTDAIRKSEHIEVQRKRLIDFVGEEKAAEVFERIKEAAYKQKEDNGSYILGVLCSINAKLQSGKFEYVKPNQSL